MKKTILRYKSTSDIILRKNKRFICDTIETSRIARNASTQINVFEQPINLMVDAVEDMDKETELKDKFLQFSEKNRINRF